MPAKNVEMEQDTRELILSVAARLFLERGFANVSIRDICEQANVTPPTIYHYFGNKDGLFQAVIHRRLTLKGFREALIAAVGKQPDPEAKLCVFIDHYLTSFPRDFVNPGMFLQSSTQLFEESTQQVMSEFEAIDTLAESIIQDGINKAIFRDIDPNQAAKYLTALLLAVVLSEVHYYQSHNLEKTTPFVFDLFLNGLRRQD